jgi:hypothetical protein
MSVQTEFYTIIPYKNLLFIKTFLSWDEIVAKNCIDDVSRIVSTLYQKNPYAILADRTEWQLNTPEAEQLFTAITETVITRTLTHSAIVVGNSKVKKWQVNRMIEGAKTYETKIFVKMPDAQTWLASFGYQMET